jgi:uncharacterized membrane protein YccC
MFDPLATIRADGPDYVNLRKAGRAAIVMPAVLAFGTFAVGSDSFALYACFAAFVALVFADYGGPPKRRARAYLTMIAASSVVVALGGMLSTSPVAGVVGMFVVMFVATFATVFGGYMALHVAPVALGYSLSVLMPPDEILIPDRVAGWILGGVAAMAAALVLWPIERRTGLLQATAELASGLLDVVAALADPAVARARLEAAREQVASLQERLSTPLRPYGPATRDIAFVQLILHLEHGTELAAAAIEAKKVADQDAPLQQEVMAALERTGAVLSGDHDGAALRSSLERLDAARRAAREALEDTATRSARRGVAALDGMRQALPLLALSHVAMWIEYEAARVMGLSTGSPPDLTTAPELSQRFKDSIRTVTTRAGRAVTLELDPAGVVLRNSIRAGIALAAAILLADVLPLEHGFWIALGALCVLRSGASSTYATALEAIAGTVSGFVVAALVVVSIGDDPALLWLLFPIAVAFAAFSPGAIHFAVGQAAFTVMVVILFSLIDAPGFETAVVRLETVSIGAITAAILSLILWPRGARPALGHAVARVYRAAAAGARTFVAGSDHDRWRAQTELAGAWRGAEAAFSAALAEHNEPIDAGAWVVMLQPPTLVRSLLSGLVPAVSDPAAGCGPATVTIDQDAGIVADRLAAIGAYLDPSPADRTMPDLAAMELVDPDDDLERCIADSAGHDARMLEAMSLVGWSAWLEQLASSLERARPAVRRVAAASAPEAWLRRPASAPLTADESQVGD